MPRVSCEMVGETGFEPATLCPKPDALPGCATPRAAGTLSFQAAERNPQSARRAHPQDRPNRRRETIRSCASHQPDAGGCEMRYYQGENDHGRSEENTSELQSLMRISYAVFCL